MTFTTLLFIITLGSLAIMCVALTYLFESRHKYEDHLAEAHVEIAHLKKHINHLKDKIDGNNQQPVKRYCRKGVRK